jgi:hypothetical protein
VDVNIVGEETTTGFVEQTGESVYEKVLDEQNILEEVVV